MKLTIYLFGSSRKGIDVNMKREYTYLNIYKVYDPLIRTEEPAFMSFNFHH